MRSYFHLMESNVYSNLTNYFHILKLVLCIFSHGRGMRIESPFDKGWWQNIVDFIGWRISGILRSSRQNWVSTYDVESKKFDNVNCDDKEPLLGSSNGIV